MKKSVTFWQTWGWRVEIPEEDVEAFSKAVDDNDMSEFFETHSMPSHKAVHYEGQVVSVEDF